MNWKTTFFKPKWQHKNPEVRALAVSESRDPELLESLETIAVSDESVEVRLAAARRLEQPLSIVDALEREADASVKEVLGMRLRSLLTNPDKPGDGLDERLDALNQSKGRELWEAVAMNAPEPELRRAALARVERPGFLGDRAIDDPDPDLRRLAASRISQASTLKRVIEAARKKDKALHLELTQRLHEEQLEAGDKEAIRREALAICEQLEEQAIRGESHDKGLVAQLEARWSNLGRNTPQPLQERFEADLSRLRQPPPPAPPSEEPTVDDAPVTAIPPEVEADETTAPVLQDAFGHLSRQLDREKPPAPRRIEKLEARWKETFSAIEQPNEADRELDQSARSVLDQLTARAREAEAHKAEMLTRAREQLEAMQQALDDGELHKALELRSRLQADSKSLSGDRDWKPIQSQMVSTMGRLRELRDWQHWANDKIRKRLITEMEALPGSGLHPDAVLDRIKSLQTEWKSLEASEQIPGDRHYAATPWMWRRFNAAGREAFELTKPYLDKRSEVQARELETIQAQAGELLKMAAADGVDQETLNQSMSRVRKALRSLSSVPAKERKKSAALLKKALEAGKAVKQKHFEDIEKKKLKLIREAAQLQHMDNRDDAMALAKSLQAQWKDAGSLWRSRENELWQQFREPIDPLFAALDEERDQVRAEQAERRARQEALCDQLETLLSEADQSLAEQQGRVQGLSDEWSEFRQPDRRLRDRFERALAKFNERLAEESRQEASRERVRWWAKADTIHEVESTVQSGKLTAAKRKKMEQKWSEAGPGESEIDQSLDRRFVAILDPDAQDHVIDGGDAEAAREICIGLEFLAGLPGPEAEKAQRMQYQVKRLSDSMTGERDRVPALEEAKRLEREWLMQAWLPDEDYLAFRQRVRDALSNLIEE